MRRVPALLAGAAVAGALGLSGCATAPARTVPLVAEAAPAAASQPTPPSPRDVASEIFHRGKAYALAGETACARAELQLALDTFQRGQRREDAEDVQFGEQLHDSVQLYLALLSEGGPDERPPAEDTQDTLLSAEPAASAEEVEKAKAELAESWKATGRFDIPVTVNDAVLRAIAFYQFRTPQHFAAALQRSGRYLQLMRSILEESGLPQDLVYVAMIESAFKHQAHSRKAAHGFWQFIDGTAQRYGLRRTRQLDERSDFIKSTRAAAAYLRDLYEMFGDWYLALAGYSSGEGRVIRGLQRTGARDYWELCAAGALPKETRDYVPFVLAASLISKDPMRFGFDVVPDPPLSWDVVTVSRPVELPRVAEAIGVPAEEIRLLNSELRGRSTPHGASEYPLRVPAGSGPTLVERLASLPAAPQVEEKRVAVRRGDTLAKVAARYRVAVEEICDLNELTRTARLKRGMSLVIPLRTKLGSGGSRPAQLLASAPAADAGHAGEIRALPTPAAAITSAAQVARTLPASTGVSSPQPVPALPVPVPRPAPSRVDIPAAGFETVQAQLREPAEARVQSPSRKVSYTVRRGDTLFSIAEKHGTTVDALRRTNRIGPRALLRAGQQLVVVALVN